MYEPGNFDNARIKH